MLTANLAWLRLALPLSQWTHPIARLRGCLDSLVMHDKMLHEQNQRVSYGARGSDPITDPPGLTHRPVTQESLYRIKYLLPLPSTPSINLGPQSMGELLPLKRIGIFADMCGIFTCICVLRLIMAYNTDMKQHGTMIICKIIIICIFMVLTSPDK
jgi:hypothetical protein